MKTPWYTLFGFVLLSLSFSHTAKAAWFSATGQAAILNGDKVAAREQATEEAIKQAKTTLDNFLQKRSDTLNKMERTKGKLQRVPDTSPCAVFARAATIVLEHKIKFFKAIPCNSDAEHLIILATETAGTLTEIVKNYDKTMAEFGKTNVLLDDIST